MNRLLVVLLIVLISPTVQGTHALEQTREDAATEKALIDGERKINEAIAKGDKATFLSFVAGDAVWAGKGGFVPVALLGESFDQMNVTKWEVVNPQVVWVNPTTAVVAYSWAGSGSVMGQPLAPRMIVSTMWTKRADKWVAVYHQESDAPRQ
jgi:hypothetical protein